MEVKLKHTDLTANQWEFSTNQTCWCSVVYILFIFLENVISLWCCLCLMLCNFVMIVKFIPKAKLVSYRPSSENNNNNNNNNNNSEYCKIKKKSYSKNRS